MSAIRFAPVVAVILVLQSYSAAAADFSSPPFLGNVCTLSVCGKGKCAPSTNSTFPYECECEEGWRQARSNDDQHFKFLPCVIPNCSLNNSCAKAPAPPPRNQIGTNASIFDPCYWQDCRGGSCNKTSPFTRSCICDQGYYNLFNSTTFPCYKECEIGLDCARLGINIMNPSNPSPPTSSNLPANSNNHGTSLITGVKISWSIALATTLALVGLNYS